MPRRDDHFNRVLNELRHELRNTLSPIGVIADTFALQRGGPEIDVLVRDVRLLSRLVEDLAAFAYAARTKLASRALPLADLVRHAGAAAPLGTALDIRIAPELRVKADPVWLEIALASLVRHAAAPPAPLVVEATLARSRVAIHIAGGVTPDEHALAFARSLVELQGGELATGDALRVSLPLAPPR